MSSTFHNGLHLISPTSRRKAIRVSLVLIISSLFDLLAVMSFFPILFLIADGQKNVKTQWIWEVFSSIGITTQTEVIMVLSMLTMTLVVLKTWVVNAATRLKAAFAYSTSNEIASRLISNHFGRHFANYAKLDFSAELNRISNLPLIFANNFVIPLGTILAESVVAILLLCLVAWYKVGLFIFLAVLAAPMIVLLRLRKQQAERSADEIKRNYPMLLKSTLQSIEGFSEIRAFGKEEFFEERLNENFDRTSKTMARDHAFHGSLARTTELVTAVAIGLLILLTAKFSTTDMIVTLGLYAAVAFRTIPSVNRVASAIMQIRTHAYAAEELHEHLNNTATTTQSRKEISVLEKVELRDIVFSHELDRPVLRGLNLTLHRGERAIIFGRSGSGKSTLLHILLNFISPTAGKIAIDGRELTDSEMKAFRLKADYVSQNPYLLDASVLENIAFGENPSAANIPKVESILNALDLSEWIASLPSGLHTVIGEKGVRVSGGQRQRLAIGRALYCDSEILLLDEATNQLDRETETEIAKIFARPAFAGKTIVLISHHPETWTNFGTLYELRNGQLITPSTHAQLAF